jgi:hypothetical protein
MQDKDRRYLVQQNKVGDAAKPPVFAKVMRSKEGVFEGVSFIANKDKATVLSVAEAEEAIAWAKTRKPKSGEYHTKIICLGQ